MARDPLRNVATLTGMRALSDNRFLGRFRLRRWRRGVVIAIAGLWLVTLAAWFTPPDVIPAWVATAAFVLLLLACVLLVLATRNLSASVDAFTDERDRAVRDRVHRIAYWALGAPFGALFGLIVTIVSRRTGEPGVTLTHGELSVIAAGGTTMFLLFVFLPTFILGWIEPDPPRDDDEPDE